MKAFVVAMVAWSGAMAAQMTTAQATAPQAVTPQVRTPEEYDKLMKRMGPANMAMGKAAASSNWAEVRTQIGVIKDVLAQAQTFWEFHKKEDALKFLQGVRERVGEVETLAAAANPDPAKLAASIKTIGPACRQCHMVYREQLEDGTSRIRPGTI
jgi:cytochrome c556